MARTTICWVWLPDVVVSGKATANMSCAGGVCTPTAAKAVLNVTELANMLAGGDVTVNSGGSLAKNVVVKDALSWTSTSRLTLDAFQSVEIDKPVTVAGTGTLIIRYNDGGSGGDLLFEGKGNATFWDLSSSLVINGNSYTLVGDIKTLAADIAANPSGFYALANDYNAKHDRYKKSPIQTIFGGVFEGLGHTISNFTIVSVSDEVGLFRESGGIIRDIGLVELNITGSGSGGGLIGIVGAATVFRCFATGTISVNNGATAGGLLGSSKSIGSGSVTQSFATVDVTAADAVAVGGLIGLSGLVVEQSFATGNVTGGEKSRVGGLVGEIALGADVFNSFSTGPVSGGASAHPGGLAGDIDGGQIASSYSIGALSGGNDRTRGGFVGQADGSLFAHDYWDIDSSGEDARHGYGVCSGSKTDKRNCRANITGLTTDQLTATLPAGFDPQIWAQDASVNGGYPYLLALPPSR